MNHRLTPSAGTACVMLLLAAAVARAQDNTPLKDAGPAPATNLSLSASSPTKRAQWQQRLTLGPGDVLNFSLLDAPELARTEVVIGPDGRVTYLQAENIAVTGLTIDELRAKFDTELEKYYRSPRTIITPAAYRSKKYFILGAVVNSGVFPLDRPTTVVEAIARAGGLQTGLLERNTVELADLPHSFLVRKGDRVAVDFQRLFQQGDLTQNIPLEPDDYLFFPSANMNEIYVLGAVLKPGAMGYSPNATVLSAITAHGGFDDKAYKSRVLVVRGSLTHPETFVVNTRDILSAKAPDFKLQPKDIVYIAVRPWAQAEELLDSAATAFIQSAVITWTGIHAGPLITKPILK